MVEVAVRFCHQELKPKVMPVISNDIICVTVPELEKCGVSNDYLWKALNHNRIGLVYCWEHHKIGNTVYIHYNSLKDKYKKLIKQEVCGGLEVTEWIKYEKIRSFLPPGLQEERAELTDFIVTRERVNVNSGEVMDEKRTKLPVSYIDLLTYQSRWYRLMSREAYNYNKSEIKKLNIKGIAEFRRICVAIANIPTDIYPEGAKLPSNALACYRNQVDYEERGITALINGRFGHTFSQKIGDEQLQVLIDLYSDPHKPDFKLATRWYNEAVLRMDWRLKNGQLATVSESCIKYNLNIKEVFQVCYLARHGAKAWRNMFGYSILRFKPSMRDAVWCGDGTKVNLYYQTPEGIAAKLNVYAIVDAHSGYWLGWDISEKEDSESVRRALKMAIVRSGYKLPFQMQYDGDSANSFYEKINAHHFPAMPDNGQSKIIERCFKSLQEQFMRSADEFTGMNITATSVKSHVNPDFIKDLQKQKRLKNRDEAIQMQERFFHIMNNTKGADGKTPKLRYFESENPETDTICSYDWTQLFWKWNDEPITYTKDGLIWTEGKIKKYYEVAEGYEFEVRNDIIPASYTPSLEFISKYTLEKFHVFFDPDDRRRIALYLQYPDKSMRFVAWAIEKTRMAYAIQDYRENERSEINKRLEIKKAQQRIAASKRQAAIDYKNSEEMLKLGYKWFDKEALHAAETEMYCGEVEEAGRDEIDRKEYLRRKRDAMSKGLNN